MEAYTKQQVCCKNTAWGRGNMFVAWIRMDMLKTSSVTLSAAAQYDTNIELNRYNLQFVSMWVQP